MISETAMQAIQIRSGLETCKFLQSSDWRGVIDRVIYDLDAAGDTVGTEIVRGILWEVWTTFPDRPDAHDALARRIRREGGGQ